MMVEIFKYTERVVNMIRPRKLLFMAIDGVAPRAKMNQQRSRRFRSAQEAKEKEEARKESVALWEAMGKEVSEEEKNKVSWDSNAITPGTPFMTLLASSLRYWVVKKMNTDPGWKTRVNSGYDPNTRHVIYGLDADLIMLALATHEPQFRVLREDVFANDTSPNTYQKPFIFLDVAILREYLEVELNIPQSAIPFSLEQAIDDWVLLIFFVGNDFLPHLPSLEIREGAIDTLLRIWKQELPRMGGYLTSHGRLELARAQIILEGLAKREDEIFRKRREAEERQDQNAKRRKLEQQNNSIGLGAAPTTQSVQNVPTAAQALAGSNRDVVANRRAIRMANLSAAEVLKAELSGLVPVKSLPAKPPSPTKPVVPIATLEAAPMSCSPIIASIDSVTPHVDEDEEVPGFGNHRSVVPPEPVSKNDAIIVDSKDVDVDRKSDANTSFNTSGDSDHVAGVKRKFEEGPAVPDESVDDIITVEEEDDAPSDAPSGVPALKVNPDGTVEQEDTVKLWEPGYKERYYRQKFGVELSDTEFRNCITKAYVEGLSWVLQYYYQGTPSWQWYYPYHFAPFAADFEDVDKIDLKFVLGQPFKPFEQLMGVFPAASRQHIPSVFHSLMTAEDSPIVDFYPETFEIDMNGKKMAWQGVALLPFIDEKRLLDAMTKEYPNLTEEEVKRNQWGSNVIFASDEHPVYPFYEGLYGKRKSQDPVPIDPRRSGGINGTVLRNPDCIPGSTYYCPFEMNGLPDIQNDCSLSALYFFPKQITPHRSIMLPGVKRMPRVLTSTDLEITRNGGRGRGRGRGGWSNEGINGRIRRMGMGTLEEEAVDTTIAGTINKPHEHPIKLRLHNRRTGPPSRGGAPPSYGGYGGYGGGGYTGGGGGGYGNTNGAYGGAAQQGSGYGGYGGYGTGSGSYGYPAANNALGYQGNSRGGAPYAASRGRGRGW
ncbi:5'-3' exoribonuclease 2 [Termitomyces sp. J132]|nr:5'-3' exoribonuclease 2 [Termitomyces sp. J132]